MSNILGGSYGLAYRGTNANQPPNWNFEERDPTQYDINYSVGDLWLNKNTLVAWVLVSLAGDNMSRGSLANWITWAGGSGDVFSIAGNTGTNPVSPNSSGTINIFGDGTTINASGDGVNTLTLSAPISVTTTTYVPDLSFGGSSAGITYANRAGYYNKIGNIVFWGAYMILTSKGVQTGVASVTMPPFTVLPVGQTPTDFFLETGNITLDSGYTFVWGNAQTGGMQFNEGGSGVVTQIMNNTNFVDTSHFQTFGFYFTA